MATSTHVSHDTHSTTASGSWSTRRIATTALLCALAFVLTFVEVPIFPPAPWLMYDPSGIVAFVAALVFGPATGAVTVGQALYWDKAAENITTAAGSSPANTPAGWAVAAAGSSDATVLVKLLG